MYVDLEERRKTLIMQAMVGAADSNGPGVV